MQVVNPPAINYELGQPADEATVLMTNSRINGDRGFLYSSALKDSRRIGIMPHTAKAEAKFRTTE